MGFKASIDKNKAPNKECTTLLKHLVFAYLSYSRLSARALTGLIELPCLPFIALRIYHINLVTPPLSQHFGLSEE